MTSTTQIDPSEDSKPDLDSAKLANISHLARRLIAEQLAIETLETQLKAAKARKNAIEETELPEAMALAGMTSFTLQSGRKVEVKEIVAGSIPEDKRVGALQWLRSNGHGGIIKNHISVALAAGQDAIAPKIVKAMEKLGLKVEQKETVHPMSLQAWARELLRNGEPVPVETLGIYVGTRATVK